MTYKEFIQNIIDTRGQWGIQNDEYFEQHHIIPKCMGGKGDRANGVFKYHSHHQNCIWLTAKEHFIAHKLLAEENPSNYKLVYAWTMFWNNKKIEITPEEYEQMKIFRHAAEVSSETRQKMSDVRKGKRFSEEHRANLSKSLCGKKHGKWYNNGIIEKLYFENEKLPQDFIPGRLPMSDIQKQALSNLHVGKHLSEDTKIKISNNNALSKKIMCVETGVVYDSIADASRKCHICNIGRCISGERKTAGGYHWMLLEK